MTKVPRFWLVVSLALISFGLVESSLAANESSDFVLEDASIAPAFTGESSNRAVTGTISPFQNSQISNDNLTESGVTLKAVLPTPPAPELVNDLNSSKVLKIRVFLGDNDLASAVQLRLISTDGAYTAYYDYNGSAVSVSDSWSGAAGWVNQEVSVSNLDPQKYYQAQVRVRTDSFTVSLFSKLSNAVTPNVNQDGSDPNEEPSEPVMTSTVKLPVATLPPVLTTQKAKNTLIGIATTLLPITALAVIAQAGAVISIIGEMLANLLGRLLASLLSVSQFFAFAGKKKLFGQVLDGKTRKTVAGAQVTLLRPDTRRVLDRQTTDQYGRYYFITNNRESYLLNIEKTGFEPWETLLHRKVNRRVYLGLALEDDLPLLEKRYNRAKFFKALAGIRIPLLILGTFSWLGIYLQEQSTLTISLGLYYVVAWILEEYVRRQPRPYGLVIDGLTKAPIPKVVVRIFNRANKLIETLIVDEQGRFKTLLNPDQYRITFAKQGYLATELKQVNINKSLGSLKIDVTMSRISSSVKSVGLI